MRSRNEFSEIGSPRLVAGFYPPAAAYDADIIVLMHERLAETIEAVDSALRQQNVSFHVSVLDQGSSAATQAAFAKAFSQHKNFGYYVAAGNLGVGGGRNFLSVLGAGDVIVGLDNDAVFADDLVVAAAVALFEGRASLGVIGFKILAQDGVTLDHFSWGYPRGLKKHANADFKATAFVGAGHAIRRKTWIQAGGYDADLFFTWEEYDFALRAIALHWFILYAGSLAVFHKVSPEARIGWDSQRMRFFVRNRLIVARKWNISWPALSLRICGYLLKAARNRVLRPALLGLADALKADPGIFKREFSPHMRRYLRAYETRFQDGLLASLYRHAILQMQGDPR
jgi:GT2 family glycosyltransferase